MPHDGGAGVADGAGQDEAESVICELCFGGMRCAAAAREPGAVEGL